MANKIIEILMRRDGQTLEEAKNTLKEMQEQVFVDRADPDEVLLEYGFEPDYLPDLLPLAQIYSVFGG